MKKVIIIAIVAILGILGFFLIQSNKRQQSPRQAPVRVIRTVNQKALLGPAKPLRHRLEAVRKQNKLVVNDGFKYTLNQLVDAFNYFPRKRNRIFYSIPSTREEITDFSPDSLYRAWSRCWPSAAFPPS